ncbi:MAG: hypothetical protein ABI778_10745 [Ignavibacteriota bacterium]
MLQFFAMLFFLFSWQAALPLLPTTLNQPEHGLIPGYDWNSADSDEFNMLSHLLATGARSVKERWTWYRDGKVSEDDYYYDHRLSMQGDTLCHDEYSVKGGEAPVLSKVKRFLKSGTLSFFSFSNDHSQDIFSYFDSLSNSMLSYTKHWANGWVSILKSGVKYNADGKLIEEDEYNPHGEVYYRTMHRFDSSGFEIGTVTYQIVDPSLQPIPDTSGSDPSSHPNHYTYDAEVGKFYRLRDSVDYKIDSVLRIKERINYYQSQIYVRHYRSISYYDTLWREVRVDQFSKKGDILESFLTTYSKDGRIVGTKAFLNGKVISSKTVHDERGRLIERTILHDGKWYLTESWKYDSTDHPIEYIEKEDSFRGERITFINDSKGNQIERTVYYEGKPYYTVRFTITY